MEKPVKVGELWVGRQEAHRFTRAAPEGLLYPDILKAREAIKHCSQFRTAIDVGAHIGAVTRDLASHFAKVVAIEAVPDTFRLLELNTVELPNVELMNKAVSSVPGSLSLEGVNSHTQIAHVILDGEDSAFPPNKTTTYRDVEAIPLDSLGLRDVDFIKIDVEGWEGPVIKGARATIRRYRPVVLVEQGGNEAKYHGRLRNEAARLLEHLGMHRVLPFPFKDDWAFTF